MNVLFVDTQGILSEQQVVEVKHRVRISLTPIYASVIGATVHLGQDQDTDIIKCALNLRIRGVGVVTVNSESVEVEKLLYRLFKQLDKKRFALDRDQPSSDLVGLSGSLRDLFHWASSPNSITK